MTTDREFDAANYWEERLAKTWGLNAVGFLGLGEEYNEALYRVKGAVFQRIVRGLGIDLSQASVLDVGSGTGFVLEQWRSLNATNIMGTDITGYAVTQLRQAFPELEVRQLDIGGILPDDLPSGRFDCISALDVLYHIVDDESYRQALGNISWLLKPGGYFLFADNFLHGPAQRGKHQVSHSLRTIDGWLSAVNLTIEKRVPQYVLMNYPIDSHSLLLHAWWQRLTANVQRSSRRARLLSRLLIPIEIALTSVVREGPTTELAVCRKRDISEPI